MVSEIRLVFLDPAASAHPQHCTQLERRANGPVPAAIIECADVVNE
jgi:hypothetical protein